MRQKPKRAFFYIHSWLFIVLCFFSGFFFAEEPWDPLLDLLPAPKSLNWISSSQNGKKRHISAASWIILFHQQVLSQADGPRSHFYPTSSSYMQSALQRHGIQGFFLGMDRLLRENSDPWVYPVIYIGSSYRKYDPVP